MCISLSYLLINRKIALSLALLMMAAPTISLAFGTTTSSQLFAILEQSDGKIIIVGTFTAVTFADNSVALRSEITRLNNDGSLDQTFDIGTGANGGIFAMVLQADGKILVGGDFTQFNGLSRNRIARLNTNGSFNTTFAGGSGFDGAVLSLALQSNGKLLAGGSFDMVKDQGMMTIYLGKF